MNLIRNASDVHAVPRSIQLSIIAWNGNGLTADALQNMLIFRCYISMQKRHAYVHVLSYYTPGRGKIVLRNYTPGRGKIVPRNWGERERAPH